MNISLRWGTYCWMLLGLVLGVVAVGSSSCPLPPPGGGSGLSQATFLISNQTLPSKGSLNLAQGGGEVDVENLTVEITKIELDRADGSQESKLTVFEGSAIIDVVQLQDLSQILTTSQIPAGTYTKIRLSIQNPHAVLVGGEEVTSDQIQLTANGRLFVSETFTVPAEPVVILLSFNGVHLVRTGQQDQFVLTPQLRADIDVQSAQVSLEGTIQSINADTQEIVVVPSGDPDSDGVTVKVTGDTEITINGEAATFADLTVGLEVTVQGLIDALGVVTADTITTPVEGEPGEGELLEGE